MPLNPAAFTNSLQFLFAVSLLCGTMHSDQSQTPAHSHHLLHALKHIPFKLHNEQHPCGPLDQPDQLGLNVNHQMGHQQHMHLGACPPPHAFSSCLAFLQAIYPAFLSTAL